MKQIERLIQFAINNGYDKGCYQVRGKDSYFHTIGLKYKDAIELRDKLNNGSYEGVYIELKEGTYNNTELITSKPFIEAVARGIIKKLELKADNISEYYEFMGRKLKHIGVYEHITTQQAMAIRDNKLNEFIINLIGEGKKQK